MSQQPYGAPDGQPAATNQPPPGLDLSAVRTPRPATGGPAGTAAAPGQPVAGTAPGQPGQGAGGPVVPSLVFDTTEATFNSVVELSASVPVVVDLWADWCQPCKQLSPILDKLVDEYAGRIVLAKVDVDANPQIQQLFQAQSIPTVVAIVKGQPVPLFQGALPEPQVRQYFEELLKVAETNGVSGTAVVEGQAAEEQPLPPKHQEAYDALERGDLDAAASAFSSALAEAPADADAKAGLAQVGLLQRTRGLTLEQVRQEAAQDPTNVDAALRVADLDVAGGHVEDAFIRILDLIRRSAGDDREQLRLRMLDLFEVVGTADPRVNKARSALTRALF
ncbi:tetratricopeptide repeat protein [Saxibacter everestensis]|uniref:Tetratricopeptide repeat protein n=1 Tax=Saxibacter everestensis TaxID=2909229 RepID=A0ABY8QX10_9MICO|nr:tetratricopeptide repeat protein [Brevibacteriaceae bacterium ZFBP1038]